MQLSATNEYLQNDDESDRKESTNRQESLWLSLSEWNDPRYVDTTVLYDSDGSFTLLFTKVISTSGAIETAARRNIYMICSDAVKRGLPGRTLETLATSELVIYSIEFGKMLIMPYWKKLIWRLWAQRYYE